MNCAIKIQKSFSEGKGLSDQTCESGRKIYPFKRLSQILVSEMGIDLGYSWRYMPQNLLHCVE